MIISGLCFVYIMLNVCPDPESNPGPLDCKSEALPTELCTDDHLSNICEIK